jgi:diguanylate cyclase (GGDEF)-like protein
VGGDRALRAVADVLRDAVRDQAFRYGGEEFSLVLTDATVEESRAILERVRTGVADALIEGAELQPTGRLTVSIGAVVVPAGALDACTALERADAALYHSKRTGRDRVTLVEATSSTPERSRPGAAAH